MSAQRSVNAWDRPAEEPRGRPPFKDERAPAPRRKAKANGLWIAFLASLVLHSATVGTAIVWQFLKAEAEPTPEPSVEIVDASQFPNLKLPKLDVGPAPSAPADVPKPDPDAKQIVALAKPDHPETAPKDAKYLAEDDHDTDHETVARDVAVAPKVLADKYKGLADQTQPDATSPTQGTHDAKGESNGADAKTDDATRGSTGAAPKPLEHLTSDPFGIRARPLTVADAGTPGNGADHDAHTVAAGEGTKVAMAGAPNNDYLPGVAVGDSTNLKAKEFFFASFWHRFQEQVDPIWARKVNERVPEGLQKRDYLTRVDVTLSPSGAVLAVDVTKSCGIDGWDRAVVEAINEAGPFMNPPKGLIEADGKIHMGDLGFIVSLTGGNVVHMYGDPRAGKLFPGMGEGLH